MTSYLTSQLSDFHGISTLVRQASEQPMLEPEREEHLVAQLRSGDPSAAETLVRQNLRMAIDEAILNRALGMPQTTLIRVGIDALKDATATYVSGHDITFREHARRVVRSAMMRALETS